MNHRERVRRTVQMLKAALRSPQVLDGIAYITVQIRRENISIGEGKEGKFLPLKPLEGHWRDAKGRERVQEGYRNGGKPLRDTGALYSSQWAKGRSEGDSLVIDMGGLEYGKWQDRGFSTKGPNFIPLTRKGARGGSGLRKGKDFIVAPRGVTVPPRSFIAPKPRDFHDFGRSIFAGLNIALKGK